MPLEIPSLHSLVPGRRQPRPRILPPVIPRQPTTPDLRKQQSDAKRRRETSNRRPDHRATILLLIRLDRPRDAIHARRPANVRRKRPRSRYRPGPAELGVGVVDEGTAKGPAVGLRGLLVLQAGGERRVGVSGEFPRGVDDAEHA